MVWGNRRTAIQWTQPWGKEALRGGPQMSGLGKWVSGDAKLGHGSEEGRMGWWAEHGGHSWLWCRVSRQSPSSGPGWSGLELGEKTGLATDLMAHLCAGENWGCKGGDLPGLCEEKRAQGSPGEDGLQSGSRGEAAARETGASPDRSESWEMLREEST